MPPAQARVQIPYYIFHGFRSRSSLHPWLPYVTRTNAGSKLGSLRLAISYFFYNKILIAIASSSEGLPIYRTLVIPTRVVVNGSYVHIIKTGEHFLGEPDVLVFVAYFKALRGISHRGDVGQVFGSRAANTDRLRLFFLREKRGVVYRLWRLRRMAATVASMSASV